MSLATLIQLHPASDYVDQGVHPFVPHQVLSVKESSRRGHKTVYVVEYRAIDGSGYRWKNKIGGVKASAQRILEDGEVVERRILSLPEEGTYISIAPQHTIQSFVATETLSYSLLFGVSALYLVSFGLIKRFARRKQLEA